MVVSLEMFVCMCENENTRKKVDLEEVENLCYGPLRKGAIMSLLLPGRTYNLVVPLLKKNNRLG